jgi:hypothetical protein
MTILVEPEEAINDILSLCAKVLHDADIGPIAVIDLIDLRDRINYVRRAVSVQGYKAFPRLRRSDEG